MHICFAGGMPFFKIIKIKAQKCNKINMDVHCSIAFNLNEQDVDQSVWMLNNICNMSYDVAQNFEIFKYSPGESINDKYTINMKDMK